MMPVKNTALPLIVLVFAIAAPCKTASGADALPELGAKVGKHLVNVASHQHRSCMTASAQLDPCFEYDFDNVRYTIAFDARSKRVTYVSTVDQTFRTAEGLQVGDVLTVTEQNVRVWPGCVVFGPSTKDGWQPILGGLDGPVRLKDGSVVRQWGKSNGRRFGLTTILGFAKGPKRS